MSILPSATDADVGNSTSKFRNLYLSGTASVSGLNVANSLQANTVFANDIQIRGWNLNSPPDYVFEDGYDLRSLKDVESFIRQNKHLPEIPSAATMQQKGLGLADMNLLLLKKVEELTLYVLAQQKEIEKLKKHVTAQ